MKTLFEFLSSNVEPNVIYATDDTIKQIVKDELDKFGHDGDLNHIDVSKVTNMESLFYFNDTENYTDINPDISEWNVINVKNMCNMFRECKNFNSDISKWITNKVKDMRFMFWGCKKFNSDLSNWNVSNVKNMRYMFFYCESFNQDLSQWNVSKVEDMTNMFSGCKSFNRDISTWNVDSVEYHGVIFNNCPIKEEYKPKFNF